MDKDTRLRVFRAIDKLDRIGPCGVLELLTIGRRDKSGDFTRGVGLGLFQAYFIMKMIGCSIEVVCYRPDKGSAIVVVGK